MVACLVAPAASIAAGSDNNNDGKVVRLLVSHDAGGGYDTYARLYGRHVGKHLPGTPSIVVQNMPGAAGVVMTNYLFTRSASDGTVIGLAPGSIATAALFGSAGARYDARDLTWLTMRPDWVQQHKINILVQFSLTPHPDLKDVPTILEFARDDEQRALLKLIFAQASMGRVVFAPPRVAADRAKELRDAFDATLEDPEFKSDAERMHIEIVAPLHGAQVDSLVRELYLAPPGRIKEAATAVGGS
jgi:tripartite-type tricarboxylate transporter receptor subunit TctC